MTDRTNAPIIVKRKKVIARGGHHGGAWKVAMFLGPIGKGARFAPDFQDSTHGGLKGTSF